jgi:ATP-dependent DNA ligase
LERQPRDDLPRHRCNGPRGDGSKRADSRYKSGPPLKAKCFVEADIEVLGVVREQGEARLALLAAADGSRKYVGTAVPCHA